MINKLTVQKSTAELLPIYLKLPTEHIGLLKFLFESYEELGIVRTLDAARGEVVILALTDTVEHARNVIHEISTELSIQEIPPPEALEQEGSDWLLYDFHNKEE